MRLLLLAVVLLTPTLSAQTATELASPKPTLTLGAPLSNPTNGEAHLSLSVAPNVRVTVQAFDLLGRQVATLASDALVAGGPGRVTFDGAHLPDGVYLIIARSEMMQTQRLVTLAR